CTGLKSIAIPDSVESIGEKVFRGCTGLTSIAIPDSVESIGDETFFDCTNLSSVILPTKLNLIDTAMFQNCTSLTSVTIPDSVTVIGSFAFDNCTSLTSIAIPESVTVIAPSAFESSGLKSVTIPGSITNISEKAFYWCKELTDVTLCEGVTSIEYWAFSNCYKLSNITIPDSLTFIGKEAFFATDLTSITLSSNVTTIESYALVSNKDITIYCHEGSVAEAYAKARNDNYVLIHFFDDEWNYDWSNSVRYLECKYCDVRENENLENTEIDNIEFTTATDPETEFIVEKVENENDERYALVVESFKNNQEEPVVEIIYDITLENNEGVSVQPDNSVRIKLPLSETHGDYKVYRVNDDGTYTDMNGTVEGGFIVFITDHFSLYVVADVHKHNYSCNVSAPTCTEEGYTLYTCRCGDSYKSETVAKLGHSYKSTVTTQPTHTKEGIRTFICEVCKYTYTEKIAKTTKHTYTAKVTAPTCTTDGYTTYTCACGDSYTDKRVSNFGGHTDNDHNGICDRCRVDTTIGCSCRCHKNDFIWKFLNFFYKLFKMNHYCACGKAHY
ncbi:MAG: leucine-rich repeat domain-containing protein, partial [Clostridia bacterium]|nr:leucine-rich repeat domain-containing protein [Clostridia bacterium]